MIKKSGYTFLLLVFIKVGKKFYFSTLNAWHFQKNCTILVANMCCHHWHATHCNRLVMPVVVWFDDGGDGGGLFVDPLLFLCCLFSSKNIRVFIIIVFLFTFFTRSVTLRYALVGCLNTNFPSSQRRRCVCSILVCQQGRYFLFSLGNSYTCIVDWHWIVILIMNGLMLICTINKVYVFLD